MFLQNQESLPQKIVFVVVCFYFKR